MLKTIFSTKKLKRRKIENIITQLIVDDVSCEVLNDQNEKKRDHIASNEMVYIQCVFDSDVSARRYARTSKYNLPSYTDTVSHLNNMMTSINYLMTS